MLEPIRETENSIIMEDEKEDDEEHEEAKPWDPSTLEVVDEGKPEEEGDNWPLGSDILDESSEEFKQ